MSALVRLAIAILLLALAPGFGPVVSAQSTPEPQRYGREGQDYASQFADVIDQMDTFWLGIFEGTEADYRPPAVTPLEDFVITGCGPAGPENFAFYCPRDEAIYYFPDGFAEHERRIGDFAPSVVTAHEGGPCAVADRGCAGAR